MPNAWARFPAWGAELRVMGVPCLFAFNTTFNAHYLVCLLLLVLLLLLPISGGEV